MSKYAILLERYGNPKVIVEEFKLEDDAWDRANDLCMEADANITTAIVLTLEKARLLANDILLYKE